MLFQIVLQAQSYAVVQRLVGSDSMAVSMYCTVLMSDGNIWKLLHCVRRFDVSAFNDIVRMVLHGIVL